MADPTPPGRFDAERQGRSHGPDPGGVEEELHADAATVETLLEVARGGPDVSPGAGGDAARTGVRSDALRVTHHHDGYTVAVGGRTRGRLDRSGAAERLRANPVPVTDWRYWRSLGAADGEPPDGAEHDAPPPGDHGVAWLRWLEGAGGTTDAARAGGAEERYRALADGIEREWGELAVRATLVGPVGERRYELRHRADRDAAAAELTSHDRPRRAREIATFDDRGRYRPLKTAPSLQRGWRFPALTGPQLVAAVDFLYPATVANWHRERRGELDVTHYHEAARRQTGIYGVIDELTPENVAHLAETCCTDSQCLRRREWDEDEETPLDVPRGEGAFPCREPCSLVVSAARTFTTAQDETPREYTFALTPTEKNQLERLLEAVADGEIDEIREADLNDGANRYRARYLRARRLTERGLCDVPTFEEE